jgi:hypothetical protein
VRRNALLELRHTGTSNARSTMPARKHHFVPQFYQKGFTNPSGLLCVYDRKLHTYKHLPPKVLCREENLYTVRHEPGVNDTRIESEILSPIEGDAAPVIRSLGNGYKPTQVELAHLIVFISLQFTRLPSFGKAVTKTLEALMERRFTYQFGNLERAAEALVEMGSKQTPEEAVAMVEDLRACRFRINATEVNFLRTMFNHAQTLGNWLQDANWTFLVAPASSGFIICDHPFTAVPPQGAKVMGAGWGYPGTSIYFPLTRRLCLKAVAGTHGFRYLNTGCRTVKIVNHNIATNSDRFVMGPDETQLRLIIERSQSVDVEPGERFSITEHPETQVLKFVMHPRRYYY